MARLRNYFAFEFGADYLFYLSRGQTNIKRGEVVVCRGPVCTTTERAQDDDDDDDVCERFSQNLIRRRVFRETDGPCFVFYFGVEAMSKRVVFPFRPSSDTERKGVHASDERPVKTSTNVPLHVLSEIFEGTGMKSGRRRRRWWYGGGGDGGGGIATAAAASAATTTTST